VSAAGALDRTEEIAVRKVVAPISGAFLIGALIASSASATPSTAAGPSRSVAPHSGSGSPQIPGDIDGDGRSDLVATVLHAVRVYYTTAAPGGSQVQEFALPDGAAPRALVVGDFDGDGYDDLAVGSPNSNPTGPAGAYDGAIWFYKGSATGIDPTAHTVINGPAAQELEFGYTLIGIDYNHDGRTDVLEHTGNSGGKFKLFFGSASGVTSVGAHNLNVGDVAGVAIGDVNGDHRPDLVVGRPDKGKQKYESHHEVFVGSEGFVSVFYGRASGGYANKAKSIHGLKTGIKYGMVGASIDVARVNRDKYADVVVGAPNAQVGTFRPGAVMVLYGAKHGLSASRRTILNQPVRVGRGTRR
jgi:hypothetical protein